ncbi:hypothetical protein CK203_101651 [Vitis vinifera]|uniref:Retrotransposon gag domain-containing protein n=1 Tax=Vitis vinifera TaxID=29760 RepID=A0A438D1W6_VITVI|nr:hypothetical protein CK203_101651 [Vitis vinifera]
MEITPEDQHSHHGHQDNPNEPVNEGLYASTSYECTIMYSAPYRAASDQTHIVPLLPTFHGMESENPYAHIKEFEDVCNTFQEGGASIDLMRLKLFPFTLKDKAKIWLNSLRPRTYFYDGMSSSMKQLLETMCGGDFMSKNPEEAIDFLSYVAEVSRGWDEPHRGKVGKMNYDKKSGGARTEKVHEVQAVAETLVQVKPCSICQSYEHLVEECPTIPVAREMFGEQANVIGQFKPNSNASYGNTYNSSWRNQSKFFMEAKSTSVPTAGSTISTSFKS